MFLLINTAYFEPAGEQCGTLYDEEQACPLCGSGAKQKSDLFLEWKRIPKKKDVAMTIAREIVVSRRLVDLLHKHNVKGGEYLPVRQNEGLKSESKEWYQLSVESDAADLIPPTVVGNDPFDLDEEGRNRCPNGDLLGLNLLSEVSMKFASYSRDDIVTSKQFIGTRRGLIRPQRLILISRRLWHIFEQEKQKGEKIRGIRFEIAHIV
jgi:hypothetical protein